MRTLDRRAIEERGVPSLELMERGGKCWRRPPSTTRANAPGRAVCFCGPGNNGGDGGLRPPAAGGGLGVRRILVGAAGEGTWRHQGHGGGPAGGGRRVLVAFTPDDPDLGLVPEGGRDGGRHPSVSA